MLMIILVATRLVASTTALSTYQGHALKGKKVFVTGASGGLGAGIARHLAVDCGARVLVHYHTRRAGAEATQRSILEGGGHCDGLICCDFRSPAAIDDMWYSVDGIWEGEIDVLVNNAGIVAKAAAEDDLNMTLWRECMQVNLDAPMQLSVAAHRRMKRQSGGGVVCMISSIHGSGSVEWMTAYAASKAALDRLTAGLAAEWGGDGIRVVGVAPGVVPVERTAAALETREAQALWRPHLPVGRMGTTADVASAVAFVLANGWTTGSVLTVDGGMMARANMPARPRPLEAPSIESSGATEDRAVEQSTGTVEQEDNPDEDWMDDMNIIMGMM